MPVYDGGLSVIIIIIFKYALIHQSELQKGVVIKTYTARLISLPASCVFYVTRQVCLKINMFVLVGYRI